jgi:hypothetical protein
VHRAASDDELTESDRDVDRSTIHDRVALAIVQRLEGRRGR